MPQQALSFEWANTNEIHVTGRSAVRELYTVLSIFFSFLNVCDPHAIIRTKTTSQFVRGSHEFKYTHWIDFFSVMRRS